MAKAVPAKETCFVISPIGDPGTPIRDRADTFLTYIVKRVLEKPEFGYDVRRADEINEPGRITQQIIERVYTADLVVADLTGRNANVFYELAIRHAARKPVIHMITAGETLPFDLADQRTIPYDIDVRHVEESQAQLAEQVKAVRAGAPTDNPVSAALQLLQFEKSDDPTERGIGQILAELAAIRETLTPVIDTGATRQANLDRAFGRGLAALGRLTSAPPIGLDPELVRRIGEQMQTGQLVPMAAGEPLCANCGKPIGGSVTTLRSSDSKPIHPPGRCPPPPAPPAGPTSGAH